MSPKGSSSTPDWVQMCNSRNQKTDVLGWVREATDNRMTSTSMISFILNWNDGLGPWFYGRNAISNL